MKKTIFALSLVLCLFSALPVLAGSFSDSIRTFLEIRNNGERLTGCSVVNFGSSESPVFSVVNGIRPDAISKTATLPAGVIVGDIGLPVTARWERVSEPCDASCGVGVSSYSYVCKLSGDVVDDDKCVAEDRPASGSDSCLAALCPATNCAAILRNDPTSASGTYSLSSGADVWCDMDFDGGGWTVLFDYDLGLAPGYTGLEVDSRSPDSSGTYGYTWAARTSDVNQFEYVYRAVVPFSDARVVYTAHYNWPSSNGMAAMGCGWSGYNLFYAYDAWTDSVGQSVQEKNVAVFTKQPTNMTDRLVTATGLGSRTEISIFASRRPGVPENYRLVRRLWVR